MEEDELGGRSSEESLISDESSSLLPARADSDRSWTVTRAQIEARNFDLKAVNPNAKGERSAHAGRPAGHHRGEAEGDRGRDRRAPLAELSRAAHPPQCRPDSATRSRQWLQTHRPASVDTECERGGKRNPERCALLAAGERSLPGQDRPGIGGAAQARNPGSTGEDAALFNFDPPPSRPENFGLLHLTDLQNSVRNWGRPFSVGLAARVFGEQIALLRNFAARQQCKCSIHWV